ncbi:MAG: ABC transporter ATP-binding protein/permease [Gammaproteobacteria bacterium]|nr:ABC transporter ATP-binding protein/permease [Gammaproteobacteria bacterium]
MATKQVDLYGWVLRNSTRALMILASLFSLILFAQISLPLVFAQLFNELGPKTLDWALVSQQMMVIGALILLWLLMTVIFSINRSRLLTDISFQIHRQIYSHILSRSLIYFQRQNQAKLLSSVSQISKNLENNLACVFVDSWFNITLVLGLVAGLLYQSLSLGVLVMALVIVSAILQNFLLNRCSDDDHARRSFIHKLGQKLNNISLVKALSADAALIGDVNSLNARRSESQKQVLFFHGLNELVRNCILFALLSLVTICCVFYYVENKISIGGSIAVVLYALLLLNPVNKLLVVRAQWSFMRSKAKAIVDLLTDGELEKNNQEQKSQEKGELKYIVFDHISMKANEQERFALDDLQFHVSKNECVALVLNEAENAELIRRLLLGLKPSKGRMIAGNYDLRVWDQAIWRQRFVEAKQLQIIFPGTVLENIKIAKPDVDDMEIRQLCEQTGLMDILQQLPQSLQTPIGAHTTHLSDLQIEAIVAARIMLAQCEVIFYDSPLTQADNVDVYEFAQVLAKLAKNSICLVITQHEAILQQATRVVFISNGCVQAQGSHSDLLLQDDAYAKLFSDAELPAWLLDLDNEVAAIQEEDAMA